MICVKEITGDGIASQPCISLYLIMGTIFSRNSLIKSRRRFLLVPYVFNTTATCQSPILTNKSALRSESSEGELYLAKIQ